MGFSISGFEEAADEFQEFADELREIESEVDEAFSKGLEDTGESMVKTAKRKAPVKTGELRESIGLDQEAQLRFRFEATADYAMAIEFGSGLHGPTGSKYRIEADDGGYLKFENQNGETIYRKFVMHPGVEENPFFVPAWRKHVDEVDDNVFKHVNKLFENKID